MDKRKWTTLRVCASAMTSRVEKLRRELRFLGGRAKEILTDEGWLNVAKKGARYAMRRARGSVVSKPQTDAVGDILYIDGCPLAHPSRYRVAHQVEQLRANGLHADSIWWQDLRPEHVAHYRAFVFFRAELAKPLERFAANAKRLGKPLLYDIDDLLFDAKYLASVSPHYRDGVRNMRALLDLCDYATTSTIAIQRALPKPTFVNRNVASEEMWKLSPRQGGSAETLLCYASGSTTHNADLAMIAPALVRVLASRPHVRLRLIGLLDLPPTLRGQSRVEHVPFTDWKALPALLREAHIHLAPMQKTRFNQAKSENKWTEAALVERITVASKVGGFAETIRDGVDGRLVTGDWYKPILQLVDDADLRDRLARQARVRVEQQHTTIGTGHVLARFMRRTLKKNVGIVLASTALSGGTLVAVKHGSILRKAGYDVTFLAQSNDTGELDGMPVVSILGREVKAEFDTLVATLWSTVPFVATYPRARVRAYLVQNYEPGFFSTNDPRRQRAEATYRLANLRYLTISRWCESWLNEAAYAPNGIDTALFAPVKRSWSGIINVLVEGNSGDATKNVDESFAITNSLDRARFAVWYVSYAGDAKRHHKVERTFSRLAPKEMAALYQQAHILLKSSTLESFSYPPLEMMATGGAVVVRKNEGNAEYVRHGENALSYETVDEARSAILRLANDAVLRLSLAKRGIATAKSRDWKRVEKQILSLYQSS